MVVRNIEKDSLITQEFVRGYFDYLPEGRLQKKGPSNNQHKVSGYRHHTGYRSITINIKGKKVSFMEHRLIFLYHTGTMPIIVDHINREKSDNRIENLRESTYKLNPYNRNKKKGKFHSNFSGVSLEGDKWRASIWESNRLYHIGYFKEEILASLARDLAVYVFSLDTVSLLNHPELLYTYRSITCSRPKTRETIKELVPIAAAHKQFYDQF
jgi:hypothetical protein